MKTFGTSSFAAYLYGILAAFVLLTAPVADAAANPLLGTWEGTSYEQSSGKTWSSTLVVNSDNTYSGLDASTDGKGSYLHSGTYSYSFKTITITVTSGTCTGDAGCNPPVGTIATFPYTISGSGVGSTMTVDGNVVTKTSEPLSNIPASERQVLLDLYASANGTGWTNNAGWGGAAGTECTWFGVTCDATLSHITEIQLRTNNLAGTLPSISGLTHIQVFRVLGNQLTGSFPSVSGLTSLIQLSFRQNQFTGSLPSLSGLTSLQTFNASENHLTGSIPSLSDLTALYELDLDTNQLSGPVPALPASFPAFLESASVGAWVCNNSLTSSGDPAIDAAWNTATGTDWLACQTPPLLTVTLSGSGNGAVTSDTGGINCGSTCSASFTGGTSVTLTATPADNNTYFFGWSGDCSGAGSCVVTMSAAKNVTATFKPVPFVATTIKDITPTSATITTTVSFNAADVGKTGAVYVTAWTPASGLSALGILSAPMSQAMSVTVTHDNPYLGGKINTRQESLASVLAAADPNAFVLVQLTSSGWQLVENGQLIPYASGVLGDSMSALSILNNADPANLLGAQFCVGYGTSAAEMVASGRMIPVADIPGATATTNGSCNVAANPYKGLWWNPAESGWGMSVTQHDTINFVALYTYDQNAQPVWYVMSNCPIVSAGSCTGDIYQVTGGTPPGVAWNGTGKAVSVAGSGTLTFSDTNHGQFDFTLNGATGSKTIERQLFSSGTAAQALDYTDLWWNASENGWGVALTQDMGMIFDAWYTYDAAGQPVWYVASSCPLSGSGCTGDVYKVTGGTVPTSPWAPNLAVTSVGSVSFAFSDSGTGTMSYTIDGVAGTRAITRQAF